MSKKRRVFVGYELSDMLKQKVVKWQELHDYLPVRWTPRDNLHVTLVPPWYTEDVEDVITLLRSMKQSVEPFSVLFESLTIGPEDRRPWLLWARGQIPEAFLLLRAQLIYLLQRQDEKRTPVLHTTIARFDKKKFERFPDKNFSEAIQWEEKITSFSLIESHLRRTGAVYETLVKVEL